jgi:hypothetical protein
MQRSAVMAAVTTIVLATAAPAHASFHSLVVNEVGLSAGGDSTKQFVEVFDPVVEPFPALFAPFRLIAYDGAGTMVGSPQDLNATGVNGFAHSPPVVLASPSSGIAGDQALSIALPPLAGQLCYVQGGTDAKVDCVTWGTITSQVSASSLHGPAPVDGQSLQRQCDKTLATAAPTPRAANANVATACGGSGGGGTKDTVKPKVRVLGLALSQKLGRVVAHGISGKLKVDEPAKATLELRRGRAVVGRASVTFSAAATRHFRVKLKPAAATSVSRLSKATLTLRFSVKDTAGNVTKTSRTVKLKA